MEKINKEELMKKLELTEIDLEKVAGGRMDPGCINACQQAFFQKKSGCEKYGIGTNDYQKCIAGFEKEHIECIYSCD